MPGSVGNRLRLSGKLIKGERRYVLQCEDESVWRLNLDGLDLPNGASEVVVDGTKSASDVVDVDWIGAIQ